MRQARMLTRTILFLGMVCLFWGAPGITQPASAQVYGQCPAGYYYVPNYGCAPLSYVYGYPYCGYPYYYGYPYCGYPYFGFDFFYGGHWGGRGGRGYGYHGGARGGMPGHRR